MPEERSDPPVSPRSPDPTPPCGVPPAGAADAEDRSCSECGQRLDVSDQYCGACGAPAGPPAREDLGPPSDHRGDRTPGGRAATARRRARPRAGTRVPSTKPPVNGSGTGPSGSLGCESPASRVGGTLRFLSRHPHRRSPPTWRPRLPGRCPTIDGAGSGLGSGGDLRPWDPTARPGPPKGSVPARSSSGSEM
jgi:hypothetical protein